MIRKVQSEVFDVMLHAEHLRDGDHQSIAHDYLSRQGRAAMQEYLTLL